MKRFSMFIVVIIIFSRCNNNTEEGINGSIAYFDSGTLSRDISVDSVFNAVYSRTLHSLGEVPLKGDLEMKRSYRLTVIPFIYNAYCIRIDNTDTVTTVTFKVAGDRMDFVRSGLTHLDLTYESMHPRMDSLYLDLHTSFTKYDFYPGFDEVDYVAADGTIYLLESFDDGQHKVVRGRNAGAYKGKEELLLIIDKMHSFLPKGLLPNLRNVRSFEDLMFPVLKRDSSLETD